MSTVDDIKARHTIASVLAFHNVEVKGGMACCPFHDDHNPSFSIYDEGGKWKCHSGPNCGSGDVVELLAKFAGKTSIEYLKNGLTEVPKPITKSPISKPRASITVDTPYDCAYDYRGVDGTLLYQVRRYSIPKKTFRPHDPKTNSLSWKGERVPYRLPYFVHSKIIWITEGEKDAERLSRLWQCATTRCGGSSTWETELTKWFKDKDVVFCGDNDAPGLAYYEKVKAALLPVAKSFKRVIVPAPCKDISEYTDGMYDKEGVLKVAELLESAELIKGGAKEEPPLIEKESAVPRENRSLDASVVTIPTFYYAGKGGYAMESKGRYVPLPNEGQVKAHLINVGVDKNEVLSRLCSIREENFVGHIGPVAGLAPGLHRSEDAADNFLVTVGPNIIKGEKGQWPFISNFFNEMLDDQDHPDQLRSIYSWIHQARLNLVERTRRPLPALVLVGPRECGKTFFIELNRLVLGGRMAPALGALNGTTNFNADIVGAELLHVDDEIASRDHRARVGLAQGIKRQLFAQSVRVEAKGRDAISLRPVQVLVIAVNDEAEHLNVLPHLDDSLSDKISLYHCRKASFGGLHDRQEIGRIMKIELPAFIHHMEQFAIPEHLINGRTGATAWQHPKVIELLACISQEERLRELLLQCEAITSDIDKLGWWEGTASAIEKLLTEDDTTRHSSRSLLTWNGATGTYLSRLLDSGRVEGTKRISRGQTLWKLTNLSSKGGGVVTLVSPIKE